MLSLYFGLQCLNDLDPAFFLDTVFSFCPLLPPCAPDHLCALNTPSSLLLQGSPCSCSLPWFYQISLPDWRLKIWRPYLLTPYPISCYVFFSCAYNFINGVVFILMCSGYSAPRNVVAYTEVNTQWRVAYKRMNHLTISLKQYHTSISGIPSFTHAIILAHYQIRIV